MRDARKVNRAMTTGELPEEWTTWVVVYSVPRDARSLRLVVRNPSPRDGQARLVAVPIRTWGGAPGRLPPVSHSPTVPFK